MTQYNGDDDDEVIARALQEEYDREMNRRRNNNNGSSSRPPEVAPSAPPEGDIVRGPRGTETDEEYARRLAREEERLYQYHQQRQSSRSNNGNTRDGHRSSSSRKNTARDEAPSSISNTSRDPTVLHSNNYSAREGPITSTTNVVSSSAGGFFQVKRSDSDITPATSRDGSTVVYDDEDYARRVEQELNDEELARRMQESDEHRASRYAARAVALESVPRNRFKCFCSWLIGFTIIGAGIVAFFYFFYVQDNGSPRNWIWDPSDFAEEDPFDAKRPEDITPWRNAGKGLNVEVLNALDPEWNKFFYMAILDWDTGYPDSLTLSTETRDPDPACSEVAGKVKVCNGNYGATSWKGINEVHIDGSGYIYASTARLNDFYFNGNNEGSMQYTMCHELGHAWGLPHTDEIFGNRDLGNCMDYTHNEKENSSPDFSNYDFLFRLYGLVPGAEPYDAPTAAPTYAPLPTFSPVSDLDGESNRIEPENNPRNNPGNGKDNGKNGNRSLEAVDEDELQTSIVQARERILSGTRNGVRTLYRGSRGEIHETDIANGHKLRVHKLLAPTH